MFKKLFIALMLMAASLAQAKTVLICAMMDGQLVERCCCDNETRPTSVASEDAMPYGPCCTVAAEASEVISLAAGSLDKQPVKKLWDSSPDLATAPPAPIAVAALNLTSQTTLLTESPVQDGSRLYLLTARLRL
jgi:hypothetical protein